MNDTKKILVFSHAMEIGGAERALIGLLDSIDYTQYHVDLFLMRHDGDLLKYVNKNVNLLPESSKYSSLAIPIKDVIKKRQLGIAFGRCYGKLRARSFVRKKGINTTNDIALEYSHKYTKFFMPLINPNIEYDLAVSFLTPHYFVADKVFAKRKIAWIHTDYSVLKVDRDSELKMWSKYDNIVSISKNVTDAFTQIFPELSDRIILIENIQPESFIRFQAEMISVDHEMPSTSTNLLSIGRFTYPKNFDNIPDICRRILDKGINVKWYIIGFGPDEALIKTKIKVANVQDNVIILGKKENPYPYIKKCDIYIQPSRYEGKAVTVTEAQMLGKPVIITNYSTANSQLKDGVDGIIVSMDNETCANDIISVIEDMDLRNKLISNCKKREYSNKKEIFKFYSLIS